MEQYTILLILITITAFYLIQKVTGGKKMNPAVVKEKLDSGKDFILLDVRTKAEYLERHIPKSILIPVDVLENEAGKRIPDKNAEIIVYCLSGGRSSSAVRILRKLGYANINNLGGIQGWPYETVSGNK